MENAPFCELHGYIGDCPKCYGELYNQQFSMSQIGLAKNNKWFVGKTDEANPQVFIEAPFKDFHDTRLYVNGDFASIDDMLYYAGRIADILNGNIRIK